jgi:hypothetical protein
MSQLAIPAQFARELLKDEVEAQNQGSGVRALDPEEVLVLISLAAVL